MLTALGLPPEWTSPSSRTSPSRTSASATHTAPTSSTPSRPMCHVSVDDQLVRRWVRWVFGSLPPGG
eukprot:scaffold96238_cov57-Phaeocystis_antarctica.AAC.3